MESKLENPQILFNCLELMENIINKYILDFKDLLSLRLVNKTCYYAVSHLFNRKIDESEIISGRATYIVVSQCWNCEKDDDPDNLIQTFYVQDIHPTRLIISCNSAKCRIKAIKSYIFESFNYEKKIILYEPLKIDKCIIPRSDGSRSNATIKKDYLVYLNEEIYLHVEFYQGNNNFYKCCSIQKLYEINEGDIKLQFRKLIDDLKINTKITPFYSIDMEKQISDAILKLN